MDQTSLDSQRYPGFQADLGLGSHSGVHQLTQGRQGKRLNHEEKDESEVPSLKSK